MTDEQIRQCYEDKIDELNIQLHESEYQLSQWREDAKKLQDENKQLKKTIEALRNCTNCDNFDDKGRHEGWDYIPPEQKLPCDDCKSFSNWKMKEKEK